MKLEVIKDWITWEALKSEWNALLAISNINCIFQTWEWMSAWASTVSDSAEPFVITCRNDKGELVGVAAFYKCDYVLASVVPVRILRGFGEPDSGMDYPGFIYPKEDPEVLSVLLSALSKNNAEWDAIWLPISKAWDSYDEHLLARVQNNTALNLRHRLRTFTWRELPASAEELQQTLSKSKVTIIKRAEKKINKSHKLEIQRESEGAELVKQLEALFHLHALRWQSVGESGAFVRRPKLKQFYEEFVPLARSKGWLRLHIMMLDGKPCAAQIGYSYNDCYYSVQEGFDPDAAAGSGNVLRLHVMRDCASEGLKVYDFLEGPSEHKRSWGGIERVGMDVLMCNKNWKSRLINAFKCWPGGRLLKEKNQLN